MQLLWNTLDVVQPVNTHDDFHAIEALFELLDPVHNLLLFEVLDTNKFCDSICKQNGTYIQER